MKSGQVAPFTEYSVQRDGDGACRVFDPSGLQVAYFAPRLDGDLAPELARRHAAQLTFELRFMADFLKVSREQYIAALAACYHEVNSRVAAGAL